jgi:hypothetical protein
LRIKQRAGVFGVDGEIDVFGYCPCPFDNAQAIELGDNNACHRPARVEKRAAAVSGLDGGGYLQLMRVIMRARQPADDPRGDAGLRAQQSLQREADDNHRLTWFDRNVTA